MYVFSVGQGNFILLSLLYMCCGNMCQASLGDQVRGLQDQIDNGVNVIIMTDLLSKMVGIVQKNGAVVKTILKKDTFPNVTPEDKEIININTFLLLAFPNYCLRVTQLVEEIEDLEGVSKGDIKAFLGEIKEHLKLDDSSDSPIARLHKRY
jgi:hypothetical protein